MLFEVLAKRFKSLIFKEKDMNQEKVIQIFDENSKAVFQLPTIDLEELTEHLKPTPELIIAREVVPDWLYRPTSFSRYLQKPAIPKDAKIAHETIYMGKIESVKELTKKETLEELNRNDIPVYSEEMEREAEESIMWDKVTGKQKHEMDVVRSIGIDFDDYGVGPIFKVDMKTELIAGRFVGYAKIEPPPAKSNQPFHCMELLHGDASHMEIIKEPKLVVPRIWVDLLLRLETTYHEPIKEQYDNIKSLYLEAENWLNK